MPLEVGFWKHTLKNLDSAVVENKPVSMSEGQVYVYENSFPGYTVKYIHVDNLAVRTCGARASLKSGGIGTSTLLIILHADANQEIRSVVDIWGVEDGKRSTVLPVNFNNMKSMYLQPPAEVPAKFGARQIFEFSIF
ncbi:Uncharacterized protein OBRU01_14151 [Operophtera brumata]|uniref:Uncharacterized protein n=1 Tax=Operophtera brumata TaxID=104452 RepID=A0A0L7L5V5_OPEBR|nr:Uncharacterized protein OBRU01_14151 [Operophtera brumata]